MNKLKIKSFYIKFNLNESTGIILNRINNKLKRLQINKKNYVIIINVAGAIKNDFYYRIDCCKKRLLSPEVLEIFENKFEA
jgi:hypothetical protein